MTNAFLGYLEKNYFDLFLRKVNGFFTFCHNDLVDSLFHGQDIDYIHVDDLAFISVSIADAEGDGIFFDVILVPEVHARINLGHGDFETKSANNLWVMCSCSAIIGTRLENFRIHDVNEYSSRTPIKKPLDGNLVPFVKKTDFSNLADEMLNRYYPEAINQPVQLNVHLLAKRMGLTIIERKISEDRTVFGRLFFDGGKAVFCDKDSDEKYEETIGPNTIVIDSEAAYGFSFGEEDLTIAHECVHAFFHRKAFKFAKMLNSSLSSIVCSNSANKTWQNKTLQWMEWQANSVAPYLLMPTNNFKAMVHELYKREDGNGNFGSLNDIENLIAEIAENYATTKQAARRRLIDIGFEAAIGCLNWMDGRYVPAYGFQRGSLKAGETYTISSEDIGGILSPCTDQNLIVFLVNGAFIYVENHLVIRNAKFVEIDESGVRLTDYARHHLDECAVKFKVRVIGSNPFYGDLTSICYLCKNSAPILKYSVSVSDNKSLIDSSLSQEALRYEFTDRLEIEKRIAGLPLCEALVKIQKYREIPNYKLADRSSINERTLRRYLKGDTKVPNKRVLLALCIGLKIHNLLVINRLLSLAGLAWNSNDPEDDALREIFQHQSFETAADANTLLVINGLKPLTNE